MENGCASGPGIFDMKSGVEVIVAHGGDPRARAATRREIRMFLSCDEESGSTTSRDLITAEASDCVAVFVLEPSLPGGKVKTARKGIANYEVIARGISAHAGLDPEKGISAISELASQIAALNALNDLKQGITVNVGVISGGTLSNVVASEARAEVDVRFRTMAQGEDISRRRAIKPYRGSADRVPGGNNRLSERTAALVPCRPRTSSLPMGAIWQGQAVARATELHRGEASTSMLGCQGTGPTLHTSTRRVTCRAARRLPPCSHTVDGSPPDAKPWRAGLIFFSCVRRLVVPKTSRPCHAKTEIPAVSPSAFTL